METSAASPGARQGGPLISRLSLHKTCCSSFPWDVFGFSQQSNELCSVTGSFISVHGGKREGEN